FQAAGDFQWWTLGGGSLECCRGQLPKLFQFIARRFADGELAIAQVGKEPGHMLGVRSRFGTKVLLQERQRRTGIGRKVGDGAMRLPRVRTGQVFPWLSAFSRRQLLLALESLHELPGVPNKERAVGAAGDDRSSVR